MTRSLVARGAGEGKRRKQRGAMVRVKLEIAERVRDRIAKRKAKMWTAKGKPGVGVVDEANVVLPWSARKSWAKLAAEFMICRL
jgi:hypothetical protein